MKYAIILSNTVVNVVLAESAMSDSWIDVTDTEVGIGWTYENGVFAAPVVIEPPVVEPLWTWFIDLGPFYDRFGEVKMAILTSQDVGVKAILTDLNIRKWVDLKHADVAAGLHYIATIIPSLTAELISAILTTPVSELENMALKKVYF